MQANNETTVLMVLSRHIGKANGIPMRQLQQQLDMSPRHVRKYITDLREDAHAICGTPNTGYYMAETPEELNETCDFLHHRAIHSLSLESKLRKIPLADLIGQLHLPT